MELPSNVLVLGASTERKLRSVAAALLFAAFAAYFLYDGFVGYPRKNLAALHDTLNPRPVTPPPMNESVHPKLAGVHAPGAKIESLEAHLGPPGWTGDGEARWFGPAGSLQARVQNGVVSEIAWIYGPFKDVYLQRWIGFALVAVMSGCVVLFVRVLLTRAVVDAGGLSIRGHRHIAYDEILSLVTDQWTPDGTIDLEVRHHGKPFLLRLDSYTYGGLPELVVRVCEHKGWAVPPAMRPAGSSPPAPLDHPSMPTG
ncbi:MAG: hypothetical protein IT449_00990 [Phycisphaerales bacterium]|nr:hypothetical protein [Phycisphaerales bacterium]